MIQIKNAKELDGMRRANALSAAALKYGGEHIEAGMTTWELDKLIYDFIVKHGGIPNFKGLYGFPGTACISLNDTIIHGIPSHDIVIRPGDIVSIDTGAKVDGFNGDNACTYGVGKIDLEAQRLLDVTKAALYKGIEQAKAGNRIGDIGYAVQSYCEDAGFSVVREFVGHGTGLYKSFIRPYLADALIYHHTPDNQEVMKQGWLAIETAAPDASRAALGIFSVTECGVTQARVYPRGLSAEKTYRVTFDNTRTTATVSGFELINNGVNVRITGSLSSELVTFEEV